MKREDLFEALRDLDPEMLEQARHYEKKKKAAPVIWLRWGALAASLVILVGLLFGLPALLNGNRLTYSGSDPHGGSSAPVSAASDPDDDPGEVSVISGGDPTTTTDGSGTTRTTAPGGDPTAPTRPTNKGVTTASGKTTLTTATRPAFTTTTRTAAPGGTTTARPAYTTTTRSAITAPTAPSRSTKPTTAPTTPVTRPSNRPTRPVSDSEIPTDTDGLKKVRAVYPSDDGTEWWTRYRENMVQSETMQPAIDPYYLSIMQKLLPAQDANTVCSPLNTYIAVALLAEITDGNSHQQIMNALGATNIDTLREQISVIWNANYLDQPDFSRVLANSLWLRNDTTYNRDTLNLLADKYYASAFIGQMGSQAMNEALRQWTNDNTGGLLRSFTNNMSMNPESVMEIVSTIYFREKWSTGFEKDDTKKGVFHGTLGDTTVDVMHKSEGMRIYRTDRFTAVNLGLAYGSEMAFLLPNEGVDVNSLINDPDIIGTLRYDKEDPNWTQEPVMVRLSIPKFSVSSKSDLRRALQSLGITDVFDPAVANFTPLSAGRALSLGKADHAAMFDIDENGVMGAAYSDFGEEAWAPDETVDFVLDRPFLFLVAARDRSILFSGIVRNIK